MGPGSGRVLHDSWVGGGGRIGQWVVSRDVASVQKSKRNAALIFSMLCDAKTIRAFHVDPRCSFVDNKMEMILFFLSLSLFTWNYAEIYAEI